MYMMGTESLSKTWHMATEPCRPLTPTNFSGECLAALLYQFP